MKKEIFVMTSFGPVPFEAIKEALVNLGIAEPVENQEPSLETYVQKFADRHGVTYDEANEWLGQLEEVSPQSAFSILLREIAIDLDKKYEDPIQDSPEIYSISTLDGKIHKVNKKTVKSYRNFSAFRTVEDARIACSLLRDKLKGMFKDNAGE